MSDAKFKHYTRARAYTTGVLNHYDAAELESSRLNRAWQDGYESARRDLRKALKGKLGTDVDSAVDDFLKPRR